jgi:hypothetical protein
VFAHIFLDKLYLSPKIGQLVAVVETHEHTSSRNVGIILKLDAYWQKHITMFKTE